VRLIIRVSNIHFPKGEKQAWQMLIISPDLKPAHSTNDPITETASRIKKTKK
jgi:hypothetical protein